jgi:epoxyqueuosine reductase QueG
MLRLLGGRDREVCRIVDPRPRPVAAPVFPAQRAPLAGAARGGESEMPCDYTRRVKERITGWGADLVGVADAAPLGALALDPPDLLQGFTRALSIAIQLPTAVFEAIADKPTPIYSVVYQTANRLLDEIALRASLTFQREGFRSLPVPASQVLDRDAWQAAISHKAVARMAGLGWQGKNLLIITPQYGSRVRLVTVLTDAPLAADRPMGNRCGNCSMCRDACPVGAIKGVNTADRYRDREEALHFSRCVARLTGEFAALPGIGVPICGICIKVCPFGRRARRTDRAAGRP